MKETPESKAQKIKKHILSGKPITQEIARKEYNCWRLAPEISRLIKKGIKIDGYIPHGERYKVYYLVGGKFHINYKIYHAIVEAYPDMSTTINYKIGYQID